jgi:hypothetical protein
MLFDDLAQIEQKLERLRSDYAIVRDSIRARQLRREIKAKQLELLRRQISDQLAGVERSLSDMKAKLEQLKRMGAGTRDLKREDKVVATLVEHQEHLRTVLHGLSPDAPFKKPFLWPVEFPEVFERGGFDIVIANPPYVRQEKLAAIDQETYALSFAEVHTGTADLLVYFFARAVQVVRDGGRLAFITSNKFHRAAYGEGLRTFLPAELQIERVVDFGDLAVFAAISYPSILIGRKTKPDLEKPVAVARLAQPVRRALLKAGAAENVSTVREQLENLEPLLEQYSVADYPQTLLRREGWVLEDPKLVRLFDRIMAMGRPLGEFVQGRMYRGILTGFNEAFVIDQAKRAELIAQDPRSAELIKPWLRGKDIKRWKPDWAGLYIIAIQSSGDVDCTHLWRAATTEKQARAIFADAYPAIHEHMSVYEDRLRPRADQGRWWWELRSCTYYKQFEKPKVVWADISHMPRVFYDVTGFFVGNTAYIATGVQPWLASVMNSSLFTLLIAMKSPSIQRGYFRFFSEYVSAVPVIAASGQIATELSRAALEGVADEEHVDDLVFSLYGLSSDEAEAITVWVHENLEIAQAGEDAVDD